MSRTADPALAGGEGPAHRAAKQTLLEQFRSLGYTVVPEENYGDRRVDIAVTVPTGHRIAVELQGRRITAAEMQARMNADMRHGFFGTLWIWVGARASILVEAAADGGARLPTEMRWLADRDRIGLFGLGHDGRLIRHRLAPVTRWPDEEYNEWREQQGLPRLGPRRPRTMRRTWAELCSFSIKAERRRVSSTDQPVWIPSFTSAVDRACRSTDARRTLDAGGRL